MVASTSKFESFLNNLSFILLALFIVILFYAPLEVEDIWWHLAVGQWMVEHGQVPRLDPYPVLDLQRPWYFTQWLGSLIFYRIYQWTGYEGLKIFRTIIFVFSLGLFYGYARRRLPPIIIFWMILTMAYGLFMRLLARPLIFNFIFLQLFLMILFDYHENGRLKNLLVLPLLGVVWGNLHLGSFMYGVPLISLFLLANTVEYLNLRGDKGIQTETIQISLQKVKYLGITLLLYLCAFLINPYGIEGALHPFKVLLLSRHINFYWFNNIINEMTPPIFIFGYEGLWFHLLVILMVIPFVYDKRRRFLYAVLFSFALFFFLYGVRGVDFFIFTSVYIMAYSAQQTPVWQKVWEKSLYRRIVKVVLYLSLIMSVTTKSLHYLNMKSYENHHLQNYNRLVIHPGNPFGVIQVLKDNQIHGNVFATDLYGGAILWSAYPDLKPIVDGRQLNLDLYKYYMRILKDPPAYWVPAQEDLKIKIAMLNTSNKNNYRLIDYLALDSEWQLIYIEGPCVVFVKRGAFDLPSALNNFETDLKSVKIPLDKFRALIATSDTPNLLRQWRGYLDPAPEYLDVLEEGVALYTMGFREAGLLRLMEAIEHNPSPSVRGVLREALKDYRQYQKEKKIEEILKTLFRLPFYSMFRFL